MMEPTVGQTSGFRSRDIHTKFKPDRILPDDLIQSKSFVGYMTPLMKKLGMKPIENSRPRTVFKHIELPYRPKCCSKCGSPMQMIVRRKGDIETNKGLIRGYTCNRGGTGCQNAKAKKHRRTQIVKASLTRTLNPKSRHIDGVRLDDTMIHA